MGVQGLWKLLECTGRPINPETLEGKILAVDISIWLNQAVKGARDRHGNAIENAHLLTLFHRLCKLLFFRIRPIFVFDGEAPLLKRQTLAKRRQRKDTAADDAKKTSDKLLKTFLKRQAIKAALAGNKESNAELPNLSQVRRKEEEDIYALPPLEDKDRNSSEEEEEREWEERMKHKQILQEEFFENPNSVDIESEDFRCLPPEVKHEILTDMKEFTKRRRTLFETMPEDSSDFSKYQLRGLLKKNNLNKCIQTVQKEMSQQYSGEVQAQFETEGGFIKEIETRRLVSEDTSHYILIKGVQSKADEKREDSSVQASSSADRDIAPKTYLDLKLASAHKPKQVRDTSTKSAPPSPRTLFAIEEALLENPSEEELVKEDIQNYKIPFEPVTIGEGSVSPRTLHAIHLALDEDEQGTSCKKSDGKIGEYGLAEPKPANPLIRITLDEEQDNLATTSLSIAPCLQRFGYLKDLPTPKKIEDEKMKPKDSAAKPLNSSSSDEEDDDLANRQIRTLLRNIECSPSPTLILQRTGNPKGIPAPKKSDSSSDGPINLDPNQQGVKRSLFLKQDTSDASTSRSHSPLLNDVFPRNQCLELETDKPQISATDVASVMVTPMKTETNTPGSSKMPSPGEPDSLYPIPASNLSPKQVSPVSINVVDPYIANPARLMEPRSSSKTDESYLPLTPESIELEEHSARNNDVESDSDTSFIEVEENATSKAAEIKPTISESPASNILSTSSSVENSFTVEDTDEQSTSQKKDLENVEASVNEWQDISMEELVSLENNLFVEQTSLQAQRQQQERIAATVTGQMCIESQELLRLFGIPFIVAPMEAEAQCAILDLTDQTSGTITDDSDIWLFGARHVYKNFFTQNKYVEYYQFSDIHNQLGLERSRLINLAYLMGSDYTEGIPSVGYVSAMEILNEFPGQGLESLIKFKEWWTEAQKNKKIRSNPHDTKVKKKLRDLELHPSFPNRAVADSYLKPVVDDSKGAFIWGNPDLELIREFCESRFGWYRSKTDEVLLPVLKQLNSQKTQLRIDSFFRVEQHEAQAIKSQRLRRAVTCLKRKEKEGEAGEVEEATEMMEKEFATQEKTHGKKTQKENAKSNLGKRKLAKEKIEHTSGVEGGFIDSGMKALSPNKFSVEKLDSDADCTSTCEEMDKDSTGGVHVLSPRLAIKVRSSSSSDDEENTVMVTARPVFQGNPKKSKTVKKRKK
ncbi:DNA excision repair protein ERCC-5 isoform X2 [Pelobates fuscus]|uniref:DNA excision repair protein ERCC-5 isoform X2 n=1 Tax=Pelobates fuscus TaxID=191477 RepID=UPI002FE4B647